MKKDITKKFEELIADNKVVKFIEAKDLSNMKYHASKDRYSSSALKMALNEPDKFKKIYIDKVDVPPPKGPALDFGNYMHALLLEPDTVKDNYYISDCLTRTSKQFKEDVELMKDMTVITKKEQNKALELLMELEKFEAETYEKYCFKGTEIFKDGKTELSAFFNYLNLPMQVRFDHISMVGRTYHYKDEEGKPRKEDFNIVYIRDLKTTRSKISDITQAQNVIQAYDYDLSAALYKMALYEAGVSVENIIFQWVFMDKTNNKIKMYEMSPETLNSGLQKIYEATEVIKELLKTGKLPKDTVRLI